jgi:hypothetical protein
MMNKYDAQKKGERRSGGDRRERPRYFLADGNRVTNDRRAPGSGEAASDGGPKDGSLSLLSKLRSLWRAR